MKRLVMLAVLSVVLTVFAAAALGADEAKTPAAGTPAVSTPAAKATAGQTKTGVVKKVDLAAKQVVVMVSRELTFTVTDATKIVEGDAAKKLEDIKVDAKVSVDYTNDGQQNRMATKIVILKDK